MTESRSVCLNRILSGTRRTRNMQRYWSRRNDNENESELIALEEIMLFRADAARGNDLSMDRPDLQFSAKEISRAMSKPAKKDQRRIVRMAKYLKGSKNQRIKQQIQVRCRGQHLHSVHRLRLGRLQIHQKEHVRWSCIDQHRGCQALEFHPEVCSVVSSERRATWARRSCGCRMR